jgi:hypothetical protein
MTEAHIVEIASYLANINFAELMTGVPMDWTKVVDKIKVIKMAVHCAINGPVGVGTQTNFPGIAGQHRIKESTNQPTTNSSWKGFVRAVAVKINEMKPTLDCATRRRHGDLWPIKGE